MEEPSLFSEPRQEPQRLDPDQLPFRLRAVRTLVAPAAKHGTAVIEHEGALELFDRIVDAFADDRTWLTRSEVAERVGIDGGAAAFEQRFDTLVALGAVKPVRSKAHQSRYVLDPIALISQELLLTLASRGGQARLHELLILAADRLQADDLTSDEARDICRTLARTLNVFAGDLERLLAQGTTEELIAGRPGRESAGTLARVEGVAEAVRERFPTLVEDALTTWDAGSRFNRTVEDLVDRLIVEAPSLAGGGLLALLDDATYVDAALSADGERLAGVAATVVVDAPWLAIDRATLEAALGDIGATTPARRVPDEPADDAVDAATELQRRLSAEERRHGNRRRWAERLLTDRDTTATTDTSARWPDAAVELADALALARDRAVPVTADLGSHHEVDPDADVAVRFPWRLRRLDPRATPAHQRDDRDAGREDEP